MAAMPDVFLLWHVSHALRSESAAVEHLDEHGTPLCDERAGDDVKLLGVYSSSDQARARITTARLLPGFREEPDCFQVAAYSLNRDEWRAGFVAASDESERYRQYENDAEVLARIRRGTRRSEDSADGAAARRPRRASPGSVATRRDCSAGA